MINNKVQLTGYLGEDAKPVAKDGKRYVVLNVATNDSYLVKQGEETKWLEKEAVWHDVFVFKPSAIKTASALKKGQKIELAGSISYKLFTDEKGHKRKQAIIVGQFIDKIDYKKQDKLFTQKIVDEVAESLKS